MALTRAQYLEHVRRIFGKLVKDDPIEAQGPLIQACDTYVDDGGYGTRQERIEAGTIVLCAMYTDVLGYPYDGHEMRHWVSRYGGAGQADVPFLPEPIS